MYTEPLRALPGSDEPVSADRRYPDLESTLPWRRRHQRAAALLALLGGVLLLGAVFSVSSRSVLLALGSSGLFIAVLVFYLTPGQYIPAATVERIYAAHASTGTALVQEHAPQDTFIYVPRNSDADDGLPDVTLFVPRYPNYELSDITVLESSDAAIGEQRDSGLLLRPIGAHLVREFELSTNETVSNNLEVLAEQLTDTLTNEFELVDGATVIPNSDDSVSIEIDNSAMEPLDRFDHPICSFFASGFAAGLGECVNVRTTTDAGGDWVVSCSVIAQSTEHQGFRFGERARQ